MGGSRGNAGEEPRKRIDCGCSFEIRALPTLVTGASGKNIKADLVAKPWLSPRQRMRAFHATLARRIEIESREAAIEVGGMRRGGMVVAGGDNAPPGRSLVSNVNADTSSRREDGIKARIELHRNLWPAVRRGAGNQRSRAVLPIPRERPLEQWVSGQNKLLAERPNADMASTHGQLATPTWTKSSW